MTRFPAVGGGAGGESPIASKDRAETFEESDVMLNHDRTGVGAESIDLDSGSGVDSTTATRLADDDTISASNNQGLEVVPQRDLNGVKVDRSSLTSGTTTAYIYDNGTLLDEADYSGGVAVLNADLKAGTAYNITADAGGADYTKGRILNASLYPYTSADIDITAAAQGPSETFSDNAYNIANVTARTPASTGTAYVEWPHPPDVYRWDAATFQRTEDGETVDVYVEADDGSGWTEIAGPISRGDQIDADPDSRVRFRVDLARNDVANNPTLDAIYRRWVV